VSTATDLTSREKWEAFVAQQPEEPTPEHRRSNCRRDTAFGMAELVFTLDGRQMQRSGRVLNISPGGLMVKQREPVTGGTRVLVKIACEDGELVLAGCVVHCTETVGGYKLGVELLFPGDK
jgi:hypothetical protein